MRTIDSERRLVVVDIENVLFGCRALTVEQAMRLVLREIGKSGQDQIVIAASSKTFAHYGMPILGARIRLGVGVDGADHALLEVLHEDVESRFSEVVVVSGDHIFAPRIAELTAAGLSVNVIAPRGALSTEIRAEADTVRYLDAIGSPGACVPRLPLKRRALSGMRCAA